MFLFGLGRVWGRFVLIIWISLLYYDFFKLRECVGQYIWPLDTVCLVVRSKSLYNGEQVGCYWLVCFLFSDLRAIKSLSRGGRCRNHMCGAIHILCTANCRLRKIIITVEVSCFRPFSQLSTTIFFACTRVYVIWCDPWRCGPCQQ